MTNSHNNSEYTLAFVNVPQLTRGSVDLLTENANAAIEYLADNIRWKGIIDFVVYWDRENILGNYWTDGGPGFAAYGNAYPDGELSGLIEATTGVDANGDDFDAGMWVGPGNTSIADYGQNIYIDPNPNPLEDDISSRDFLSVFLHEILHSLGFWSNLQHIETHPSIEPTKFDLLTKKVDEQWFFIGEKTQEINGGPLPLALTGSRDHYSHSLGFDFDLMREYGFAEKWQISDIDLAILSDLGHDVIKWGPEPESELDDLNGDGFVDEVTNYQMWTASGGVDLTNRNGRKKFSDSTSKIWNAEKAVQVESGFSILISHEKKSHKHKIWSANENGNVTSMSKWKSGDQMLSEGYEDLFELDLNGDSIIGKPPIQDLDGDGFVDGASNYQVYTTDDREVYLRNKSGKRIFSDDTSRQWDAVKAVSIDSTFYTLIEGTSGKNGKFKTWTSDLYSGSLSSQTKWKKEQSMVNQGYESVFNYDINDNGLIGS